MKMANFGIGVGAFAQGLQGGMQLGKQIKGVRQENEIETIRKEGLEAAKQDYEADVNSRVKPVMGLSENDPSGVKFDVGGKQFDDQGAARKAAESGVDSVEDRFYASAVPKIAEAYLAQGNVEKAESWNKFASDKKQKKNFASWSKAFKAAQIGDAEGVADYVFSQYKQIDDGITPVSKEVVKDKDGKITGFNISLKNEKTGEEYSQFVDNDYLVNTGLGFLSPQAQFEQQYKDVREAKKMTGEANIKAQAENLKYNRELAMESIKQQGRLDLEAAKASLASTKEQKAFDKNVEILKANGYDQSFISGIVPQLLGVKAGDSPYRKPQSPEETARMLYEKRMEKDYKFKNLPQEEKKALIEQDMQMLRDIGRSVGGSQQPTAKVESGGIGAPGGESKPQLVRNKTTGEIFIRSPDGTMTPADENGQPLTK